MTAGEASEAINEFGMPNTASVLTLTDLPVYELRSSLKQFDRLPSHDILIHCLQILVASWKKVRSVLPKHVFHRLSEHEGKGNDKPEPQPSYMPLP